jgi:hypothetical protein
MVIAESQVKRSLEGICMVSKGMVTHDKMFSLHLQISRYIHAHLALVSTEFHKQQRGTS